MRGRGSGGEIVRRDAAWGGVGGVRGWEDA